MPTRGAMPIGQPAPYLTTINHLQVEGTIVTTITRRWNDGDIRRCRLCPGKPCIAVSGMCTFTIPWFVADDEAEMWRHPAGKSENLKLLALDGNGG